MPRSCDLPTHESDPSMLMSRCAFENPRSEEARCDDVAVEHRHRTATDLDQTHDEGVATVDLPDPREPGEEHVKPWLAWLSLYPLALSF